MAPRFVVSPSGFDHFFYWTIKDLVSNRIIAQSFDEADAKFVSVKLNEASGQANPHVRPLLATELCDFRMKLEYENGGPLIDGPELALFFADLCDFFHFNTGERALVMGRDLLVLINTLDHPAETEELIII